MFEFLSKGEIFLGVTSIEVGHPQVLWDLIHSKGAHLAKFDQYRTGLQVLQVPFTQNFAKQPTVAFILKVLKLFFNPKTPLLSLKTQKLA